MDESIVHLPQVAPAVLGAAQSLVSREELRERRELFFAPIDDLASMPFLLHTLIVISTIGLTPSAMCQEAIGCPTFNKNTGVINEIGLNTFALIMYDQSSPNPMPIGARYSVLNGIMYKHHAKQHAWRIGIDYFRDKFELRSGTLGQRYFYETHGTTYQTSLRFGYEKELLRGKCRPYAAVDGVIAYERTQASGSGLGDFSYSYESYDYSIIRKRVGLSTTVGISYFPIERFSISAESDILLAYYDNTESKSPIVSTGVRLFLDPLRSLSLNYHF